MKPFTHPLISFLLDPSSGLMGSLAFFFTLAILAFFLPKLVNQIYANHKVFLVTKLVLLAGILTLYVEFEKEVIAHLLTGSITQFQLVDLATVVPKEFEGKPSLPMNVSTFWLNYGWVIFLGAVLACYKVTIQSKVGVLSLMTMLIASILLSWFFYQKGHFTYLSIVFFRISFFAIASMISIIPKSQYYLKNPNYELR